MVGRTSKRRHDNDDGAAARQRTASLGANCPAPGSPPKTVPLDTIHALPDMTEPTATQFMSPGNFNVTADLMGYNPIVHMDFPNESFGWNWDLSNSDDPQQPSADSQSSAALPNARSDKQRASSLIDTASTAATSLLNNSPQSDADECSKERVAHLMSLCRMTNRLETYLRSKTGTLDEIMKLNKSCLAEVIKLTSGQHKGQVCRCSFIMITTCLDIMLVLFEDVVRSSGLDPRGGGPVSDARMPNLQFGVFELEPQEQLVIMKRILARELRNYQDVVRALIVEFQEPSADFFRKLMRQWCLSLTNRLGQIPVALDAG
ncbi:uncharacterized protein E0L32_010354 [Thyridium curvatum]|uniref:Uncharacterized protein n=1 Tax=Thyridium curvatum TaxID=1093900 RepID=A0A507ASL8_9PEZI|nr:uncharacterized protein E0L32_010354 [Thyridium curvatum]TPX07899.1 hypothetical protein E0L32_010354 [Thyridium curvatum]